MCFYKPAHTRPLDTLRQDDNVELVEDQIKKAEHLGKVKTQAGHVGSHTRTRAMRGVSNLQRPVDFRRTPSPQLTKRKRRAS